MQENRREAEFDKYRSDLNPNFQAGQPFGGGRYETVLASDVKPIYDRYPQWSDDLLRSIPILAEGTRLEEGSTYFDLGRPEAGEFTGMNDMTAGPGQWIVPKADVEYDVWNLITGVKDPQRLGRFSEAA